MTYTARIDRRYSGVSPVLGPTDTRDEAARLARAWIEAHAGAEIQGDPVRAVVIEAEED